MPCSPPVDRSGGVERWVRGVWSRVAGDPALLAFLEGGEVVGDEEEEGVLGVLGGLGGRLRLAAQVWGARLTR